MDEMADDFAGAHAMPGAPEWVRPAYGGGAITNLVQSILAINGVEPTCPLAEHDAFAARLAGRRKVVLLILDGLGWHNLAWCAARHPAIREALCPDRCRPITSVFPSTTSAAMTSYLTGLPPAGHGVTGFLVYMARFGRVANMLTFALPDDPAHNLTEFGFRPEAYVGHPTCLARIGARGRLTQAFTYDGYANSGLSRIIHHDAPAHSYLALGDLLAHARATLAADVPQFLLLYWSTLDTIAHSYGAASDAYLYELSMLAHAIRDTLTPVLDGDTALIISADHGHLDGDDAEAIDLARIPGLLDTFRLPPAGEGRATHLFMRAGDVADARARLLDTGVVTVFTRDEVLDLELLGPGPRHPDLLASMGDLMVLPHGSRRTLYPYQSRPHTAMIGRHGGLTPEEMLVPLLVLT